MVMDKGAIYQVASGYLYLEETCIYTTTTGPSAREPGYTENAGCTAQTSADIGSNARW